MYFLCIPLLSPLKIFWLLTTTPIFLFFSRTIMMPVLGQQHSHCSYKGPSRFLDLTSIYNNARYIP